MTTQFELNTDPNFDEDAKEFYEERAAIIEYESGRTRSQAEAAARLMTVRYIEQRKEEK